MFLHHQTASLSLLAGWRLTGALRSALPALVIAVHWQQWRRIRGQIPVDWRRYKRWWKWAIDLVTGEGALEMCVGWDHRDVDGNGSRGGRCGETTTCRRINYIMSWCSLARSMEMSDTLLKANTWNLHYYSMLASCVVPLVYLNEEAVALILDKYKEKQSLLPPFSSKYQEDYLRKNVYVNKQTKKCISQTEVFVQLCRTVIIAQLEKLQWNL